MKNKPAAARTVAVVAGAMLLALASSSDVLSADRKCRGQDLPGTWFISLPSGLSGFYTYHHGGTMTGTVSNIFGAPPQASAPLFTTAGPDHGIWRRVGRGFEAVVFRMTFHPDTKDPLSILRIRMAFAFDPGRNSTAGTYGVDVWFCPDALSCPDPNTTPPDLADVVGPPFNDFTQTRAPMP